MGKKERRGRLGQFTVQVYPTRTFQIVCTVFCHCPLLCVMVTTIMDLEKRNSKEV